MTLPLPHQNFLEEFATPEKHYTFNDAPLSYLKAGNVTEDQLDKALDDKEWVVREAAASHPNATEEHLYKALDDEEMYVRRAANEQLKKRF